MSVRRAWYLVTVLIAAAAPSGAQQFGVTTSMLPHPHDSAKRVEVLMVRPEGTGPWPALIFVHGHQDGDRPGAAVYQTQGMLQRMARRGIVAFAVSQPGYGRSDGPPDYAGPRTQAALVAVVAHVRAQPFVTRDRVGLYGYSRGAIAASVVATQVKGLTALILGAGVYDLQDAYRRLRRFDPELYGLARNIEREAGTSPAAFRERSALPIAARITAATLLLHGANDDRAPADGARALAAALERKGTPVTLEIFPKTGHSIPPAKREGPVDAFVERWLLQR